MSEQFILTDQSSHEIIFIVGPTAVGKTAVGISLAKMIGAEILSCDSMQVYEQVRIASNKPTDAELADVPHHLIGFLPLTQSFDVARFEQEARARIQDIRLRGKTPLIIGGTGMYMKVLLDGIFTPGQDKGGLMRRQLMDECAVKGVAPLYQELKTVDHAAAQKIHPNDVRRIIRALEVYRTTGRPISQLQRTTQGLWGTCPVFIYGLRMDRDLLYRRINERVDEMFERGLLDEVRALEQGTLSRTASAIIGVKEVRHYLSGEWSLEQAKEEMKKNTRRLAKRQLTWFRAEERLEWIDVSADDNADIVAQRLMARINDHA